MTAKPKLLIVEDDLGLCGQYRWAFPAFEVLVCARPPARHMATGSEGAAAAGHHGPRSAAGPGWRKRGVCHAGWRACARRRTTKVIIATSHGDLSHALRAVGAGAYDFCEKPIDIQVLGLIAERGLRLATLEAENRRLWRRAPPDRRSSG